MEINQYTETVRVYHTNYVRNYRAVAVLWAIFTICFAIINIVAFIYPQWIGDTLESPGVGYFGLYEHCSVMSAGMTGILCRGSFGDFGTILSGPFKAATFFVGFSALLALVTIVAMLLFFFISSKVVFMICACMQLVSALCMFLGCVLYPAGWSAARVQEVCGASEDYEIGACSIRWSYILAIIAIFDAIMLCVLAFVLATRQAKMAPTYHSKPTENGYLEKNGHIINPVMMPVDRYSDFTPPGSDIVLNGPKARGQKGEFMM